MDKQIRESILIGLGLFLFALLVRLIYFFHLKDFALFQVPLLDAGFYDGWAQGIVSGDWLSRSKSTYFLSPGYPYFLAVIYGLGGRNLNAVAGTQFLLGSLNCILIYLISKEVFNKVVGITAAGMAAIYGVSVWLEGLLVTASVITFLNLLVLLAILKGVKKDSKLLLLLAGIFLGCSAQFRPNIFLFAPLIILWFAVVLSRQGGIKKICLHSAWFIGGILVILSPVIIRNWIVTKNLSFTAASGGMNFYIGNNPAATGGYAERGFDAANPLYQGENYRQEAARILGRELTPGESSKFWFQQGLDFIKSQPQKWLKLLGRKFILFWNQKEIPMNYNYYFFKKHLPILKFFPLGFSIIAPLGLLGMVISALSASGPDQKSRWLLVGYMLAYVLMLVLFFVSCEYRYPVVPVLLIFAGYSCWWIVSQLKERHYIKNIMVACGLVGLIFFVNFRKGSANGFLRERSKLAAACMEKGKIGEGIREFEELVKSHPGDAGFHYNLGVAYTDERVANYIAAAKELELAVQYEPHGPYAEKYYYKLGEVYVKLEDYPEAKQAYLKVIQINPRNAGAQQFLGNIHYLKGRNDLAIKYWQRSLEIYSDNPSLRENILKLKGKKGDVSYSPHPDPLP